MRARILGWALVIAGAALGLAWFELGLRPRFLEVKLFALYASFFQTRRFAIIEKNVTSELAALLLLGGLFVLALSRREEDDGALRLRAMEWALAANTALMALSLFLIFGVGFVTVLVVNLFSPLVLYLAALGVLRAASARHKL